MANPQGAGTSDAASAAATIPPASTRRASVVQGPPGPASLTFKSAIRMTFSGSAPPNLTRADIAKMLFDSGIEPKALTMVAKHVVGDGNVWMALFKHNSNWRQLIGTTKTIRGANARLSDASQLPVADSDVFHRNESSGTTYTAAKPKPAKAAKPYFTAFKVYSLPMVLDKKELVQRLRDLGWPITMENLYHLLVKVESVSDAVIHSEIVEIRISCPYADRLTIAEKLSGFKEIELSGVMFKVKIVSQEACSICFKTGHRQSECPNKAEMAKERKLQRLVEMECFSCKKKGHLQKDCPSRPAVKCYACKSTGHVVKDCPRKAEIDSRRLEQQRLRKVFTDEDLNSSLSVNNEGINENLISEPNSSTGDQAPIEETVSSESQLAIAALPPIEPTANHSHTPPPPEGQSMELESQTAVYMPQKGAANYKNSFASATTKHASTRASTPRKVMSGTLQLSAHHHEDPSPAGFRQFVATSSTLAPPARSEAGKRPVDDIESSLDLDTTPGDKSVNSENSVNRSGTSKSRTADQQKTKNKNKNKKKVI